jgi:hypothetical protein
MRDTTDTPAPRPCTIILTGREGQFTEKALVFRAGFAVGPFSLGQQGDWRVRAEGVASLHAYLWFDGLTLHAARLRGGPEAWLDGEPLREDWSPLPAGAELRVGAAKVVISTEDELSSQEQIAASVSSSEPASSPARPSRAARPASLIERLGLARSAGLMRRAVLVGCCVSVAALLWVVLRGWSHSRREPSPVPSARSSAAKVGSLAPPAPEVPAALASSSGAAPAMPESEPATRDVAPSVEATASEPTTQRLEQRAADAVLRGDFQAATEIYAELSTLVPSSQTFAVAKRVATRKAELAASGR